MQSVPRCKCAAGLWPKLSLRDITRQQLPETRAAVGSRFAADAASNLGDCRRWFDRSELTLNHSSSMIAVAVAEVFDKPAWLVATCSHKRKERSMQLTKNLVPLRIRFARYSEARLANNQRYSPKFHWLAPKPKPSSPKPISIAGGQGTLSGLRHNPKRAQLFRQDLH